MTITAAVAGASGYAGGEVLRLLAGHPDFEVRTVTAHRNAGSKLRSVHPGLRTFGDMELLPTTPESLRGVDVVFFALPHGASGAITAELGDNVVVVDAGADHRLESAEDWQKFYHSDWAGAWTYGMPELPRAEGATQRERIAASRQIAVPGCNVTAITLGLAPGLAAGLVEPDDVSAVLAVGPSGAGKALREDLLAAELLGSANAYGVGGIHRHTPEVLQNFRAIGAQEPSISFTPMLVPMSRGILATTTAKLAPGVSAADVEAAWNDHYAAEPFIDVLPSGTYPRVKDVIGTNALSIGLAVDESVGRVVVLSAIDNLGKGTAGAALQSANLVFGLDEATGLEMNGVAP